MKPVSELKSYDLHVCLSDAELSILRQRAAEWGCTVSDVVRRTACAPLLKLDSPTVSTTSLEEIQKVLSRQVLAMFTQLQKDRRDQLFGLCYDAHTIGDKMREYYIMRRAAVRSMALDQFDAMAENFFWCLVNLYIDDVYRLVASGTIGYRYDGLFDNSHREIGEKLAASYLVDWARRQIEPLDQGRATVLNIDLTIST